MFTKQGPYSHKKLKRVEFMVVEKLQYSNTDIVALIDHTCIVAFPRPDLQSNSC